MAWSTQLARTTNSVAASLDRAGGTMKEQADQQERGIPAVLGIGSASMNPMVRMVSVSGSGGRSYYQRKRAAGKSHKEAMR